MFVTRTPRLPKAGETLNGYSFSTVPGGKGANQAVACARLGVSTAMIGRVGDDGFGKTLIDTLASYHVDVSDVVTHNGVSSGVATIAVDDSAENNIIIVAGANGTFGSDDLARLNQRLSDASVLLLQLEIPLEIVFAAIRTAHKHHVRVILDPAPAVLLPDEIYPLIDVITPNETEVALLVGFPVQNEADAVHASQVLLDRGVHDVIIKMGSKGVFWRSEKTDGSGKLYPAFQVKAVDTVAAGDAFNGGLAAALDEGYPIDEAILWGLAAGALSVTKAGAQPSMPDRAALVAMLQQHSADR
ncbi:MAG: ribokinase [Chloroflexota bacterium]